MGQKISWIFQRAFDIASQSLWQQIKIKKKCWYMKVGNFTHFYVVACLEREKLVNFLQNNFQMQEISVMKRKWIWFLKMLVVFPCFLFPHAAWVWHLKCSYLSFALIYQEPYTYLLYVLAKPPPSRQLCSQRSINTKLFLHLNSINITNISIIIITHRHFSGPPLPYTVSFPMSSSKFLIKMLKNPG